MTFDNLLIERDDTVAILTLNRPAVLNALNVALLRELDAAITMAQSESSIRAVVITGAGERAFAAGADIRELAALTSERAREHALFGQAVFSRLETLGKPVIAAVNGFALGGGCELAMACTLRLAAESASFGQPEINLGIIPGFGGTARLPRLVGRGMALDLLLTGRSIDAREAQALGLVSNVVPTSELPAAARALARTLASKSATAMRAILDLIHEGAALSLSEAQMREAMRFGIIAETPDGHEGRAAFLEKRAPRFEGL